MATSVEDWADEQMATLGPGPEWEPDVNRGLARLRERRHTAARGRWTLATAAAAALVLVAMPQPRALAQRCLNCSVALFQTLSGSSAGAAAHLIAVKDRKPAPDFSLTDSTGRQLRLSDFRGKVVLLDFWATWCHGCQIEIPWFIDFQSAYRDRGLVALGVSFDEDGWKAVRPWMQAKKVNYPIMLGNDTMAQRYGGVDALPVTTLIDRSGRIAAKHVGLGNQAEFRAEIEALLSER